jgi:hypothetical protein
MNFKDAYLTSYRARPLRTVMLTILAAALVTLTIGAWLLYGAARRQQAVDRRNEAQRRLTAQRLSQVRTWPAIRLPALGGASASLRTVCHGYGYTSGTFRYQLTIDSTASIAERMRAALLPRASFAIQFFDEQNFRVREIPVAWEQLTKVVNDSGRLMQLQANDAAGYCGEEVLEYRAWKLTYSLPEPRSSF